MTTSHKQDTQRLATQFAHFYVTGAIETLKVQMRILMGEDLVLFADVQRLMWKIIDLITED